MELSELLQLRFYASQLTSPQGSELRAYYDNLIDQEIEKIKPEIMKVTWIEKKCKGARKEKDKDVECGLSGYVKKEKFEFSCEFHEKEGMMAYINP